MSRKVAIVALGCPKNDVDSEIMLGQMKTYGYELVTDASQADAVIVNTCAFIKSAQEEAISAILTAAGHKKEGTLKCLVVSGCMAERFKGDIIGQMPEVDAIIGTGSIDRTADIIDGLLDGTLEEHVFCASPDSTAYLEEPRILSDSRPFKYLKIAEGCSNRCTYCVIPSLRGDFRSRSVENILKEAAILVRSGARELILIAQDVTRYGTDLAGAPQLVPLIRALSGLDGQFGIRLLYCYPELVDDALIQEFKVNPKLMPYLDLPVQHFSDSVLKRMNRRGDSKLIRTLLERLRAEVPAITLRTSYITGFPGETAEDFDVLKRFVAEGLFQHVGVFDYSKEQGTPAGRMKEQVPVRIRKQRRDELLAIQKENVARWNASRVGGTYDTIIEGVSDDGLFYVGRTAAEAPDIDPVIFVTSEEPLQVGSVVPVRFLCVDGYDMVGQAVKQD